jgi:pimeloyl-ACP methyl ester carboxylesterase
MKLPPARLPGRRERAAAGLDHGLLEPLTIDAMADQTSALIGTLGRPDVLGWSMGGMVAQALAVLHPVQVRRLVLCDTFPGSTRSPMITPWPASSPGQG